MMALGLSGITTVIPAPLIDQSAEKAEHSQHPTNWPRRYLAYMSGATTALFTPVLQAFVRHLGDQVETITFVIGDWRSYQWVCAQPLDSRIQLVYQHESLDPFKQPKHLDYQRLAQLEARYGAPNLRRYVLMHRLTDQLPYEAQLAYVQAYLEYFESLWERYRPEVLLSGAPDQLPFLAAYRVFQYHGSHILLLAPSRVARRLLILDNELEQIPRLETCYRALSSRSLTEQEHALAREIRNAYTGRRVRPGGFAYPYKVRAVPSPRRLITVWRQRHAQHDRFLSGRVRDDVRRSLLVRLRRPLQEWAVAQSAVRESPKENAFYFPLHFEPELSIDVLSTFCRDQLEVIRRVVAALPAGWTLWVKEHPNTYLGSRPLGFYQQLRRLGPVRLLDRSLDGYDVLGRCRGVITLAGTAGFEALFYNKPVLMFGHAFYEVFREGVVRANSTEEIAAALQRMVAGLAFTPEGVDRFAVAVWRCSYPGNWELPVPGAHEPSNHLAIAQALVAELRRRVEARAQA